MVIMILWYEEWLISVVGGTVFFKEKTLGLVNDHEKIVLSFICTTYSEEI